jgi:hypothetical protein
VLNYQYYSNYWVNMVNGSMTIEVMLTTPSGSNYTFGVATYGGINTPPTSLTPLAQTNITSYVTVTGKYTVRLYASIVLSVWKSKTSTAAILWKNVGIYIRYGKYKLGSTAGWTCSFPFGKSATANALLTFKYWANLTTLAKSSADSYLSAWVGSTQYNIISFSSIANITWQTASVAIPSSQLQGNSSVTVKLGVYSGTALQILSGTYRGFYFDNVTFFAQYAPSPKSIKLAIYDDANARTYLDNDTTSGSGSLTFNAFKAWTGSGSPYPKVTFHFQNNATNGNTNYNVSTVKFNYASTLYARRSASTGYCSFTVHDDTKTTWYCNYSTPSDINGYQNYNASVYIPTDWIWNGSAIQPFSVKFAGADVTNYVPVQVNSTIWVIKIPASVFAPSPGGKPIEISTSYAPNYLGPSTLRTLLFTQCKTATSWINSTSFITSNVTRLVGYIKNMTGPPRNVQNPSFPVTVRIFNESGSGYKSNIWTVTPNINGSFFVTLNPWSVNNVTYISSGNPTPINWRFEASWTNGNESASGIARFTTNNVASRFKQTSPLTTPGSPYTATFFRGFTLFAVYKNLSNGVAISPSMGATVTMNWNGSKPNQQMHWNVTAQNYYFYVNSSWAYSHYAPQGTWIQINATSSLYINQTTMTRVYVRDELTTGSAPGFSVPYTTYYWNTMTTTTLTYLDSDNGSSGISGATLKVNNTLQNNPIGTSGIRWNYTYQGNGAYQLTFFTNTTKTGLSSWSFVAALNKTHYQPASFNLNGFNIRDRYTTSTEPFYSVTEPWSFNATFYVTYLDQDAGGAPVLGANWVCTWTKAYVVTRFSNGTYKFSLSVAGLSPNTYVFGITLYKSHWANITLTNLQVVIRPINTALSLSSGSLTMFWGQNESAQLIYKDLDHVPNVNISFASWASVLAYDSQTGANWSSSLVYNIRLNSAYGSWTLTVNGSLPVGTYTLWIHFWVQNATGYYVGQYLYPTLTINSITTSLTQKGGTLTVVWGDPGRIIVNYTDSVHNGKPIPGAIVTVVVDPSIQVLPPIDNGSGLYTIVFLTNNSFPRPYPYPFTIQFLKTHYSSNTISGNLQINKISTELTVPGSINVTYNNPLTFKVYFEDLNHTVGIVSNPTFYVVLVSCNWTSGSYATDLGNGTYEFSLDSTLNGVGLILLQVDASAPPCYVPATEYFNITINWVSTSLAPHGTPVPAPWGDDIKVPLDYDINGTTEWVTGVMIITNWTLPYNYSLTATGQWQIDLNTTNLAEGTYHIMINVLKQYYQNQTILMSVDIRPIHIEMRLSQVPDKVMQGNVANFTVQLWDLDHSKGIAGASLAINGINSSLYKITDLRNGYYEIDVNTASMPFPSNVSFTISATKAHYLLIPGPGQVTFKVISPNFSTMQVVMFSSGSGLSIVILAIGIVMYRRWRRPFVIKKIEQSLKLISKGAEVEPIEGLRSRTNIPLLLLAPAFEALGVKFEIEEPKLDEKRKEKKEQAQKERAEKKEQAQKEKAEKKEHAQKEKAEKKEHAQKEKAEKKGAKQEKANKDTEAGEDKRSVEETMPEEGGEDAKIDSGGSLEN